MCKSFLDKVEDIEGWFRLKDAELLYFAIKNLKQNAVMVEIGSWCGKSLIFSMLIAKDKNINSKQYSIDPFLTSKGESNGQYEKFINNLKQFNFHKNFTHIKKPSIDAIDDIKEKIEFLFVDGFHRYDYIKKEFELYRKKLTNDAYIAFHDVGTWYGPTMLVSDIYNLKQYKFIKFQGTTILIQKVDKYSNSIEENNKEVLNSLKDFIKDKQLTY